MIKLTRATIYLDPTLDRARKELKGLPPTVRRCVASNIEALGTTPRPRGVEKVPGRAQDRKSHH
jgi:hypothetical protein